MKDDRSSEDVALMVAMMEGLSAVMKVEEVMESQKVKGGAASGVVPEQQEKVWRVLLHRRGTRGDRPGRGEICPWKRKALVDEVREQEPLHVCSGRWSRRI